MKSTKSHIICIKEKKLVKQYNNIMHSIKLQNRMDTIFLNSENSKLSNPHRLLLSLSDKIVLKRKDRYVAPSNLSIYYTWKNRKKYNLYTKRIQQYITIYKKNNFNQLPRGMKDLNYQTYHSLY